MIRILFRHVKSCPISKILGWWIAAGAPGCSDKVRIDDTSLFKKGTESRWSDEVHVVQSASGKTVVLSDGTTHRRTKVLKVPHNTVIAPVTEKNVMKVATKQHKDNQLYKREEIKQTNVIGGGRSAREGRGVLKFNKHLDS